MIWDLLIFIVLAQIYFAIQTIIKWNRVLDKTEKRFKIIPTLFNIFYGLLPCRTLKSIVKITGGDGSKGNPLTLGI